MPRQCCVGSLNNKLPAHSWDLRIGVVCRCSWPAADWPLYVAHQNFDAERPARADQRSAATVRWVVLDGQDRVLVQGRFGAISLRSDEGAPEFGEVDAPTDDELRALLQTVITRLMKMLTRRGGLIDEVGKTHLAGPDADLPLPAGFCLLSPGPPRSGVATPRRRRRQPAPGRAALGPAPPAPARSHSPVPDAADAAANGHSAG